MRKRVLAVVAGMCMQVLFFPPAGSCGIVLNEIMADPASDWDGDGSYNYKTDEWVEIYNPGPGIISLEDYQLSDDDGLWTYGFSGMLGPGEALVAYGSQSVAWQQDHGYPAYGFKMSNDGDTVFLWEVTPSDTVLVDSHSFNTHEADDDRSTGRNPDGTGEWEIFDALNPYGGTTPPLGNGLPPTPGEPNTGESPPTPAAQRSWGEIKALYH